MLKLQQFSLPFLICVVVLSSTISEYDLALAQNARCEITDEAFQQALQAYSEGNYDLALSLYECLLENEPNNDQFAIGKLGAMVALERYEDSTRFSLEMIRINPEIDIYFIILGALYEIQDDHEVAIETFSELAQDYPDKAIVIAELGFAEENAGNNERAATHIERATNIDSKVGGLYVSAGEFSLGVESTYLTQKAYRLSPDLFETQLAQSRGLVAEERYVSRTLRQLRV